MSEAPLIAVRGARSQPKHRRPQFRGRNYGNGRCSWCGGEIVKADGSPNTRRTWHRGEPWEAKNCVAEYLVTVHPPAARKALFDRDRGVCRMCGDSSGAWHADHVVPLVDGGAFTLDNLQTLCDRHHNEKTARENRLRRMARALQGNRSQLQL